MYLYRGSCMYVQCTCTCTEVAVCTYMHLYRGNCMYRNLKRFLKEIYQMQRRNLPNAEMGGLDGGTGWQSTLVSALFCYTVLPMHLRLMRYASAHMHRQNGVQKLIHSAPTIEKCWVYVAVMLKTKHKSTTPREFPGYWWLFWMQHLSHYSARLIEERRWTMLIFDRFRFATLKWLLHIAIATADWVRLYKLLYVVLDASICSPAIIALWKR